MVRKPRREYTVQRCEQPALLRMQRNSVVDGAGGWLSYAALSNIQAGLGVGRQRAQGRARHEGLFREATPGSRQGRGRWLSNAPDPDDAGVYGFQRRPMRKPSR